MILDCSSDTDKRLQPMPFWYANNGIARISWARNEGAVFDIKKL